MALEEIRQTYYLRQSLDTSELVPYDAVISVNWVKGKDTWERIAITNISDHLLWLNIINQVYSMNSLPDRVILPANATVALDMQPMPDCFTVQAVRPDDNNSELEDSLIIERPFVTYRRHYGPDDGDMLG